MNKKITIKEYLKDIKDKRLKILLDGYYLNDISIETFFRNFTDVEREPDKVFEFICLSLVDDKISYKLATFGSRESDLLNKKYDKFSSDYIEVNDNIDDEDYYYRNFFR